jgi:DNA-binding transcriptional LysR family regulator
MKLDSIDLNLLLAFDVLATERNVTRAAARLNVSQPAMSGSLSRLRALFGDRLFVRAAGEMQPTPRARQLVAPISEAIARLREALEPGARFEARHSTHEFTIGATDYVEALLIGPLMRAVHAEAPGVALRTIRPEYVFAPPTESLLSGEMDVALGLFRDAIQPRSELLAQPLYQERMVAIVRARRPGIGRKLTLRQFVQLPQIRILYPGDARSGMIDSLLKSRGHERNVALTVTNFVPVPAIVEKSDLLGIAPERLAREWARSGALRILELPIAMAAMPLTMVWHERRRHDAGLAWLRGVMAGALGER